MATMTRATEMKAVQSGIEQHWVCRGLNTISDKKFPAEQPAPVTGRRIILASCRHRSMQLAVNFDLRL
jgi:hypothetical protein